MISVFLIAYIQGEKQLKSDGSKTILTQTPTTTATTTVSPTISGTPAPSNDAKPVKVQVFLFSNTLYSQPDISAYWLPVIRETTRKDVATFAIEELIKGPTSAEKTTGLDTIFGTSKFIWFTDDSDCDGKDFSISIDSTTKVATFRFCRTTAMAGDMSGFVVMGQISTTLKQFPTIQKAAILNKQGKCLDDMIGASTVEECTF